MVLVTLLDNENRIEAHKHNGIILEKRYKYNERVSILGEQSTA